MWWRNKIIARLYVKFVLYTDMWFATAEKCWKSWEMLLEDAWKVLEFDLKSVGTLGVAAAQQTEISTNKWRSKNK